MFLLSDLGDFFIQGPNSGEGMKRCGFAHFSSLCGKKHPSLFSSLLARRARSCVLAQILHLIFSFIGQISEQPFLPPEKFSFRRFLRVSCFFYFCVTKQEKDDEILREQCLQYCKSPLCTFQATGLKCDL